MQHNIDCKYTEIVDYFTVDRFNNILVITELFMYNHFTFK